MVKEHGNLSLEQQAKLMGEIDSLTDLESEEDAESSMAELNRFISLLHKYGFIGSDKACRYRQGMNFAMDRRRKKNA